MRRAGEGKLSPKANKILLVINIILFFGALVLAVLNVHVKEYIPVIGMIFVMFVTGFNIYGCWQRLKN